MLGSERAGRQRIGSHAPRASRGGCERRDERRLEANVLRLADRAVRPVDRSGLEAPIARRPERPVEQLGLHTAAERRDDRAPAGALDAQDDGVRARPCSGLGDELIDELVEVERQREEGALRARGGDRVDRARDVLRHRREVVVELVQDLVEPPLGLRAERCEPEQDQPAGNQHRARRDDRSHHPQFRTSSRRTLFRESRFSTVVCYHLAAGWRGVACPPAFSV